MSPDELGRPLTAYASSSSRSRPRADSGSRHGNEAPGEEASQPRPGMAYADSGYWESRFQETDGLFDWYATYQELAGVFRDYCPPDPKTEVLMVGCGNSALSSELHGAGFRRIVNIDIAAVAVEKMREQFKHLEMEWRTMDATEMEFEADRFDLAVDKGTADAMMHGAAATGAEVEGMAAEVWRTLRPGGLFLLISHNAGRRPLLDAGLAARFGSSASWECLEVRRCRLSAQATFINVLRSKLDGRPIAQAFKDPALLQEAAAETKQAMRQMAFVEAFREFRARKLRQARAKAAAGGQPLSSELSLEASEGGERLPGPEEAAGAKDSGGAAERDPRKQPYCWCYVLRKPGPTPGVRPDASGEPGAIAGAGAGGGGSGGGAAAAAAGAGV